MKKITNTYSFGTKLLNSILVSVFITGHIFAVEKENLAPMTQVSTVVSSNIRSNQIDFSNTSVGLANFKNQPDVERLVKIFSESGSEYLEFFSEFFESEFNKVYGAEPIYQAFTEIMQKPLISDKDKIEQIISQVLVKICDVYFFRSLDQLHGDFAMALPVIDWSKISTATNLPKRSFYVLPPMISKKLQNQPSETVSGKESINYKTEMIEALNSNVSLICGTLASSSEKPVDLNFYSIEGSAADMVLSKSVPVADEQKVVGSFEIERNFNIEHASEASEKKSEFMLDTPFTNMMEGKTNLFFLLDKKNNRFVEINGIHEISTDKEPETIEDFFAAIEEVEDTSKRPGFMDIINYRKDGSLNALTDEALKAKLLDASMQYKQQNKLKTNVSFTDIGTIAVPVNFAQLLKHPHKKDKYSFDRNQKSIIIKKNAQILKRAVSLKSPDTQQLSLPAFTGNWLKEKMPLIASQNPETIENILGLIIFLLTFPETGLVHPEIVSSAEGLAELLFRYTSMPLDQQKDKEAIKNMLLSISQNEIDSIEGTKAEKFMKMIFSRTDLDNLSVSIIPRDLDSENFNKVVNEITKMQSDNNYWFEPYPEMPTVWEDANGNSNKDLLTEEQKKNGYKVFSKEMYDFMEKFLGCPLTKMVNGKQVIVNNPLRHMTKKTLLDADKSQFLAITGTVKGSEVTTPQILSSNTLEPYFKWGPLAKEFATKYVKTLEKDEGYTKEEEDARIKELTEQFETTTFGGRIVSLKNLQGPALFNIVLTYFFSSLAGLHPVSGKDIVAGTTGGGNPSGADFAATTVSILNNIGNQLKVDIPEIRFTDPVTSKHKAECRESNPNNNDFIKLKIKDMRNNASQKGVESDLWVKVHKQLRPFVENDSDKRVAANRINDNTVEFEFYTEGVGFLFNSRTPQFRAANKYFSQLLAAGLKGVKDENGKRHPIKGLKILICKMLTAHKVFGDSRLGNQRLPTMLDKIVNEALPYIIQGDHFGARKPISSKTYSISTQLLENNMYSYQTIYSSDTKPHITSDSTGIENVIQTIENDQENTRFNVHFGLGGLLNLDFVYARKSRIAFMFDMNPNIAEMWQIFSSVISNSSHKEEFIEFFMDALSKQFGTNMQFDQKQFLSSHWLQTDEGFNYIKKLFAEKRFIFQFLDFDQAGDLENIKNALKNENLHIDTMYLGDSFEWLNEAEKKNNIGKNLAKVLNTDTWVIQKADNIVDAETGKKVLDYSQAKSIPWIMPYVQKDQLKDASSNLFLSAP